MIVVANTMIVVANTAQHARRFYLSHSTSRHYINSFHKMTRLKLHLAQGHMICRWQSELQLSLAPKLMPSNTTGVPYVSHPCAFLSLHGDFSASWGVSKAHFSFRVITECLIVIFFASLYVICACTSLCRCVHMHAHAMWKPQVNVGCLSQFSYDLFFQTGSLTDPRAHRFG